MYEGTWFKDKMFGIGELSTENKDRYKGEFREGKKTGVGYYLFSNGSSYEGEFFEDKMQGYVRINNLINYF